jgi:hypothetical protein
MARGLALLASLAIIGLIGFLTMLVAFRDGVDVLVVLSWVVLALLAVGVIGALTESPGDD